MSKLDSQAQLLDSVVSSIKDINPWATFFIVGILVVWAIIRARSAHFLHDRIWRLIGGGEIMDPELKAHWSDVRDVESFRFRTGINFASKAVLLTTLKWLKDHNKNIKDLAFARNWIRENPWEIRTPRIKLYIVVIIALAIPLGVAITSSAYMLASPSVLLTIKNSKLTFWTDGTTAENFALEGKTPEFSVTQSNCHSLVLEKATKEDLNLICASIDSENAADINRKLIEQKTAGAYFVFAFTIPLALLVRFLAQAMMARKFCELQPPKLAQEDPTLRPTA